MTENNRFVTVALLLISDCEDAEEEIVWRAEGIQSEDRNFTENVLDFPYRLITFRIISLSLRKSFRVNTGTNYTFREDYIVPYARYLTFRTSNLITITLDVIVSGFCPSLSLSLSLSSYPHLSLILMSLLKLAPLLALHKSLSSPAT